MPDGSHIVLKKLAEDYDPTDANRAMSTIREARDELKLVTGLLYVNTGAHRFDDEMKLVDEPLAGLPLDRVRPPKSVLESIMASYREGSAPVGAGGG
jgi:2-oxoglutarate ferredoxin oxidoreductase subunit beta